MDEFFNFEDAAQEQPLPLANSGSLDFSQLSSGGSYDIDLAFAEPENDENSFTCLQHYSAPGHDMTFGLPNHNAMDFSMMGPDDFTDFPRWIDGMDVPAQPCCNCRRMRTHCKVIREGSLKGSCTSCVALQRVCSFMASDRSMFQKRDSFTEGLMEGVDDGSGGCIPSSEPTDSRGYRSSGDFSINEDAVEQGSLEKFLRNSSTPNLVSRKASDENLNANEESNPKVGARFSRESVRILRGWLSTHHRHPYPSDEEKEALKRQTGLSKTQITNWLANARRRGKVRAPRSTSPSVRNDYANAMDIPRRATPSLEQMTPLDRWKNSPPENEPASITAISKAVTSSTFSSGHESPFSYGDDGSNRSLCNVSSTSSLGTSHSSGGSFASAYSHKSRGSLGSLGSLVNRGRRRRRRQAPKAFQLPIAGQPTRTFQCTFCTETFKTKHDWQRHEKSLHLSLERWVCCPDGPAQFCTDTYNNRCVFCGLANPPATHSEEHNYLSCADRSLEERTFYRKDHLRQHLNLVHDVKFQAFSMETWKVATPEIRSRCGFCGIIMDSWTIRVDHLAEHFKGGKSMADWKGDWGFEAQVLDIVENGMPPYLIHEERNSPDPYSATKEATTQHDRTLEDWVKIGLVEYIHEFINKGATPTDDDLLLEARKIIRKAEERSSLQHPEVSWFRDLIMLSGNHPELPTTQNGEISWANKLEKITVQAAAQSNDLDAITCSKQRALKAFVNAKQTLGLTPTNSELQTEACRILADSERQSDYQCKGAVNWFQYLVTASAGWLEEFRRKVGLPRSADLTHENIRSSDNLSIDYSIHNGARLEKELVDFVNAQRAVGIIPSDEDLQREARLIIYQSDDPWNQTLADDPEQLLLFKRQNGLAPPLDDFSGLSANQININSRPVFQPHASSPPRNLHWELNGSVVMPSPYSGPDSGSGGWNTPNHDQPLQAAPTSQPSANSNPVQPLKYFLNDAQCFGRLVRELTRFVRTCMSPNNPNQHTPSDAELQHQARIVIYDDDDPWNQTAADNAEWLVRFKRDVGLSASSEGPGLNEVLPNPSWRYEQGGTGFSPPFVCPKKPMQEYSKDLRVQMDDREFDVKSKTATMFLKNLSERYQPPAQVFCCRELEHGLNVFVKNSIAQGLFLTDDMLRAKAREIMKLDHTSADDPALLEKFKALHGLDAASEPQLENTYPIMDEDLLAEFDKELERVNFTETGTFPPSSLGLAEDSLMVPTSNLPTTTTTSTTSPEIENLNSADLDIDPEIWVQPDYADLWHVNTATSSRLRRKASEKAAQAQGFTNPILSGGSGLGIGVDEAERERVLRLNGSGEVGVAEWERWSQVVGEGVQQ